MKSFNIFNSSQYFGTENKPMEKQSKQDEIRNYFLNGGKLTVLSCLKNFHTTELREIVCRINKGFIKKGKPERIVGHWLNNDKFKTYWME